MAAVQGALSAAERSMRSVFVGNIPYEATEEQLKDIFAEVGPVVSFRLVYDRETGKPKGYGFCEYKDQEMALSAMRNLNGFELNGRALRVDNAASEKSKEELKNLQASLGGPPIESAYGPEVPPEKAAEVIQKIMLSVPPEQLFEFVHQMKQCVENNPNESRNLLLTNPQLCFAVLQAQVLLKIVDVETAATMLTIHEAIAQPAAGLLPTPEKAPPQAQAPIQQTKPMNNEATATFPSDKPVISELEGENYGGLHPQQHAPRPMNPAAANARAPAPLLPLPPRPTLLGERPALRPPVQAGPFPDRDPRGMDHDLRHGPMGEKDLRPPPMLAGDKDMRQNLVDQDLRAMGGAGLDPNRSFDPRFRNDPRAIPPHDPRNDPRPMPASNQRPMDTRPMPAGDGRGMQGPNFDRSGVDPRDQGRGQPNPMQARGIQNPRMNAMSGNSPSAVSSPRAPNQIAAAAAAAMAPHDSEKAQLIMQVLQLSDQQIAMLPPEQRQSILVLKEQIARTQV